MAFRNEPLVEAPGLGAVVTGLAVEALCDPEVGDRLRALWIEAGLLVFRGLKGGSVTQDRLSRVFGEPEMHPLFADRPGQHPTLIDLVFDPEVQEIYELGGEQRGGWLPWHSDLIYTARINRGGILRPVELPREGGETGFIDQIAAYAALPEALKRRIEGLDVFYNPVFDATRQRFGRDPGLRMARQSERLRHLAGQSRPRAIHPMVYTQAETGRRVLNVSPWFADGIEGMETAEGDRLLEEVVGWCARPELAYYHRWRADDMVLWDNWRMLHCAKGVPVDCRRHMQRTTIAGDYALGRLEQTATPPVQAVG